MKLRPYQSDLIRQVYQAYRDGYRRPCIVLGCGGGKSVIVADMARRTTQKGNRVLFLVHRRELCQQIEETFRNQGVTMSLCQIQMVQTAVRRLEKLPEPSLIITDENHHCLAGSYRKIYQEFPSSYCVGVTATPVRLNGGGLGEVNDKLILGPSTQWLIENQFLAPYDYYAPKLFDPESLGTKKGNTLWRTWSLPKRSMATLSSITKNWPAERKGFAIARLWLTVRKWPDDSGRLEFLRSIWTEKLPKQNGISWYKSSAKESFKFCAM